jgi:hypothetical protein
MDCKKLDRMGLFLANFSSHEIQRTIFVEYGIIPVAVIPFFDIIGNNGVM